MKEGNLFLFVSVDQVKFNLRHITFSIFAVFGLLGFDSPRDSMPLWVSPTYRELNFPTDNFYVGFASRSFNKDEDLSEVEQQVLSFARIRLVESVYVSISADSYNSLTNTNGEAREYYSKKVVSKSTLETAGLSAEVYLDNKKRIAYAFSSIKKSELRENYTNAFAIKFQQVEDRIGQVDSMTLPRLMHFLDEITQLQGQSSVLSFLGAGNSGVDQQLDDYLSEVEAVILGRSDDHSDLNDALITLQSVLFSSLQANVKSLKVNLLTYRDTELSSEFSLILHQKLSEVLLDKVEVNDQSDYVLTGSYWPGNEGIRLMVSVNEYLDGENIRLLGTASATIDESSIQELNVEMEPETPEIPLLSSSAESPDYGGLIAEVTTQKGKEAIAFWEGEELKLAVKVSRPSYVQLINIWADGSKYLLLDNYYLGPDEVNKEYWLPFSWETACPCGMENLYLRASNRPFPPVQVTDMDGFLKLETEIDVILELTRGFKPKTDEDYLAETSLGLMTFPI